MELIICLKLDLALNNLQMLICQKNPTNQPGEVKWLVSLLIFFVFNSVVRRDGKIHETVCFLFLLIILRSILLAKIWRLVCIIFFSFFPTAFHWSLSDFKSAQVSRTLLSILVDLNHTVVWIVSIRPLISKSSSLYTKLLVTVPSAPITIRNTVTFLFHSFFNPLARSRFLPLFPYSFSFILWSTGSLFLITIIRFGCLNEIRWSVSIWKSRIILCLSFSWSYSGMGI